MVDTERVLRLLDGIRRDTEALRRLGARSSDPVALDAMKYRFITAIEGTARIAHHMCVSEGWTAPDSNSEALAELAARAVIPEALGSSLSSAVGFRISWFISTRSSTTAA